MTDAMREQPSCSHNADGEHSSVQKSLVLNLRHGRTTLGPRESLAAVTGRTDTGFLQCILLLH